MTKGECIILFLLDFIQSKILLSKISANVEINLITTFCGNFVHCALCTYFHGKSMVFHAYYLLATLKPGVNYMFVMFSGRTMSVQRGG